MKRLHISFETPDEWHAARRVVERALPDDAPTGTHRVRMSRAHGDKMQSKIVEVNIKETVRGLSITAHEEAPNDNPNRRLRSRQPS